MTSAIPLLQIEPSIAKKMYNLNCSKYKVCPTFRTIKAEFAVLDKFTIVELTCNNQHYHGLAACNSNDKQMLMPGIYLAYHRAFENMILSKRWR